MLEAVVNVAHSAANLVAKDVCVLVRTVVRPSNMVARTVIVVLTTLLFPSQHVLLSSHLSTLSLELFGLFLPSSLG